jgi:metallophosphoesterase (TIGR03767 family)
MPGHAPAAVNRRTLLAATGAAGLGAALGPRTAARHATTPTSGAPTVRPESYPISRQPAAPSTTPTTLHSVATPHGTGYRRLADGPGWARVTRTELAAAGASRAERRTALAAFVQLTDLHLTDVQTPLRTEYLRSASTGSWRPHEALTVAGGVSLIERINGLKLGPATGLPLAFAMTTGDNTDNNSTLELEWFLTLMSGGSITPDSGAIGHYEGVQNSGLPLFWQPEASGGDHDKALGFPRLPGFLAAALRPVSSPGLTIPWYSTVGNHDTLATGVYAPASYWADLATGTAKLQSLPASTAASLWKASRAGTDPKGTLLRQAIDAHAKSARTVTADPRRAPFTTHGYLAAHLDPAHRGAGPTGHGYTAADLDAGRTWYSFEVADGVLGISLDTTDRGGDYRGSVGTTQLNWLTSTLKKHADETVLIFSHHPSWAMTNTHADPADPKEKRHGGAELVTLLRAHRNVAAWINGHSHENRIEAHGSFWEVSTASHIDFPQLARVIELTDNHDGTLSLFTTLIESDAPHATDFADLSQTGLASLYRELACNTPGARTTLSGAATDRNTELLLKKP